jgi:hypothetical protein
MDSVTRGTGVIAIDHQNLKQARHQTADTNKEKKKKKPR